MLAAGDFEAMPKKEALILMRELDKLQRNLGGIRGMTRLPEAIFVIDTKKEHIAVTEARKLGLPVIAIVDTNCDPDEVDYIIPGNDDAIRAVLLVTRVIADALEEGQGEGWEEFATRATTPRDGRARAGAAAQAAAPEAPATPATEAPATPAPEAPATPAPEAPAAAEPEIEPESAAGASAPGGPQAAVGQSGRSEAAGESRE